MSTGLMLSGGGARAAYQAGVLQSLGDMFQETFKNTPPFDTYCGLSAGAINATYLAASPSSSFCDTTRQLAHLWGHLETKDVYRSDPWAMGRIGWGWLRDTALGPLSKKKRAKELLNAAPLEKLLNTHIDFANLATNIEHGRLRGLSCAAFNYRTQKSVSFLQASSDVQPWQRLRRLAVPTTIHAGHLLASSSIPILFSPVAIDRDYYGDGTIRNTAPLSPLVHMGCKKFLFIGVRHGIHAEPPPTPRRPNIGAIIGTLLNGVFFDNLEIDVARLHQVNEVLEQEAQSTLNERARPIEMLSISPSRDLGAIAKDCIHDGLPKLIRFLIKGLGDADDSSELASYLLFDGSYTQKIMEVGYDDARSAKDRLEAFFESP